MGYAAAPEQQVQQQIYKPVANMKKVEVKKTYAHVETKPKTDGFVQVVSNINPWVLGFGGICLVIGGTVVLVLLAKITPLGKMISKAFRGLLAMFKALIEWRPRG